MKKMVALLVSLMVLVSAACADCAWKGAYDGNNNAMYVVCAYDEGAGVCVTLVCDVFTLEEYVFTNNVFSAYLIDCDGLSEIEWTYIFDESGNYSMFITYTSDTMKQIESISFS